VADQQDIVKVLEETARSLKEQSVILRRQSHELMKEASRIRSQQESQRRKT